MKLVNCSLTKRTGESAGWIVVIEHSKNIQFRAEVQLFQMAQERPIITVRYRQSPADGPGLSGEGMETSTWHTKSSMKSCNEDSIQ